MMAFTLLSIKKLGATVKDIYWTLGQYDVVTIVEVPDTAWI
jgi:uncharacterized protein with GYD domain